MTRYVIEEDINGFVVYNPACKRFKRRFNSKGEAVVYRKYLIERDKRAQILYSKTFINT